MPKQERTDAEPGATHVSAAQPTDWRPTDWRLEVFESLPSTSVTLARRAADGAPHGTAVLALQQTEGRGSRGRAWASPPGNLSLSVLLRPDESAGRAGEWPLMVAVALSDALLPLLPSPAMLALKWPNDVMLRGRKLAGILIETTPDAAGRLASVILGIGVNLAVAPDVPGRLSAALAEVTHAPPPADFARALLAALETRMAQRARDGFAPVRADWLARAHPLGTRLAVTLSAGADPIAGGFAGLDADGTLLLDTAEGQRRIAAGDVALAHGGTPTR